MAPYASGCSNIVSRPTFHDTTRNSAAGRRASGSVSPAPRATGRGAGLLRSTVKAASESATALFASSDSSRAVIRLPNGTGPRRRMRISKNSDACDGATISPASFAETRVALSWPGARMRRPAPARAPSGHTGENSSAASTPRIPCADHPDAGSPSASISSTSVPGMLCSETSCASRRSRYTASASCRTCMPFSSAYGGRDAGSGAVPP
jgi:hypothetical protein